MRREYLLHCLLLFVSCVAVYLSSIADKTVGEQRTVLLHLPRITAAQLTTGDAHFVFQRAPDTKRLLVHEQGKQVFLANVDFAQLFSAFSPLTARRVLGKASDINLSEYGLGKDSKHLQLQTAKKSTTLALGKKSIGSVDYYVHYLETVYLVSSSALEKIVHTHRLFEERFLVLAFKEGLQLQLQTQNKSLVAALRNLALQADAHTKARGEWHVAGRVNRQLTNWLRRIFNLKITSYLQSLEETTEVLRLTFSHNEKPTAKARFLRLANGNKYVVASTYLGKNLYGILSQTRLEQLLQDLQALQ